MDVLDEQKIKVVLDEVVDRLLAGIDLSLDKFLNRLNGIAVIIPPNTITK